jgi:hypothetical protein
VPTSNRSARRIDGRRRAPRNRRTQHGGGLIGTTAGLTVALILLLFAVQAAVGLYARSVVTGAAYDAARAVAGHRSSASRDAAMAAADTQLRRRLGRLGDRVQTTWEHPHDPDAVRLHIRVRHPTLLPQRFAGAIGLAKTDRRVDVRVERFR